MSATKISSPLKAIKAKCLDCSCYQINEVRNCVVKTCPLYPFRTGHGPKKVMTPEQRARSIEISAKMRSCIKRKST